MEETFEGHGRFDARARLLMWTAPDDSVVQREAEQQCIISVQSLWLYWGPNGREVCIFLIFLDGRHCRNTEQILQEAGIHSWADIHLHLNLIMRGDGSAIL